MKKILSLVLVALLVMSGVVFASPNRVQSGLNQSPGNGNIMGQTGVVPSNKIFRIVRFIPATAVIHGNYMISADAVAIWNTGASGDDGITITTTTTSRDSRVAGIVQVQCNWNGTRDQATTAADSIGQENWTWLQTYGVSDMKSKGNISAGAVVAASSTAQHGGPYVDAGAGASATQRGVLGFAMDAPASASADIEVFLRCE